MLESKLQCVSTSLASVCIITLADVPLSKVSHIPKPEFRWEWTNKGRDTKRHNSLEVITVGLSHRI